MKRNLGRVILFLSLIIINLYSNEEYRWSASIDKTQAYVNEAVHLHYSCKFNSRDELHVIEFNPVGEYKDYDIHLLSEIERIEDSKRINDYEFVAFLKTSGFVEFEFDVLMKKTNQDSIENTVLGRDNAVYEQFSKKLIKQKKLSLNVMANNIPLVGDLNFTIKKDKPSVSAYEPYHFEIIIDGVGNLDKLQMIDLNISGVKVFTSTPKTDYKLTKDGYKGFWSQKFALVTDKSFQFPSIKYTYFNPFEKRSKEYEVKAFDIEVKELYKKDELLDKIERDEIVFKQEYIYYLLVFILGFLLGKVKIKKSKTKSVDTEFKNKVDSCKNLDELLILLVINNSSRFSDIIRKIEKKQIELEVAKKMLIK
ncbi:hypothetical protein [Sulfurimonas sp.]|uniref:hypothetical protein n=1 Tax=Sulfurimonas sp. TaxID=2022749 RepID=UPI00356ACA8A